MRSRIFRSIINGRATSREYRPVGRVWPNGEFSLGYASVVEESFAYEDRWLGRPGPIVPEEAVEAALEQLEFWEKEDVDADSVHGQPCTVPLTLSDTSNLEMEAEPTKYGLNGLTGTGKKMLRSGAYLLEKKLGKDDVVMTTLTVPTLTREQRVLVAKKWGNLTNQLVKYLSRKLLKAGRPAAIIGCVEIQTARLARFGQAYLHLHLLHPAYSNTGGRWAIDTKELLAWWNGALERVIGASLTHPPRIETAQVKKSVESYLAKYISKGGDDSLGQFVADLGYECVPGQWWVCSAPMREAIREETVLGPNVGAILEAMVNHLLDEGTGEGFEYIRHVDRRDGGRLITCGWVGRLSPVLMADIKSMLDVR